jgi:hypothetical protein
MQYLDKLFEKEERMRNIVGYTNLYRLEIGDELLYIVGKGSNRCEARVEVTRKIGKTGGFVRIVSILKRGKRSKLKVDTEIMADAEELFFTK